MKLAALVALRLSPIVLSLAGAELSKIFCSLGNYILVQLHLDPPQLLPCVLMSVTNAQEAGPLHPEELRGRAIDHRCGVRGRSGLNQKIAGRPTSKSHVKEDDWVLLRSLGHGCGSADAGVVKWW